MKRSALAIAALILGTTACTVPSDREQGDSGSPNDAKPPVSVGEARRTVKDLDEKEESDSLRPTYWRNLQEGPWLDRSLARLDNIKKRGKPAEGQLPTNRARVDPATHAWVAKPRDEASGDWILGARQVSDYTYGSGAENTAMMRWSLHHRSSRNGAWKTSFVVAPQGKKDLPKVAANRHGAVPTVPMHADLAVQPGKACGAFIDYVSRKDTGKDRRWSSQIKKYRSSYGDTQTTREQLGDPRSVKGEVEVQRTPVGPAWRTQDGGALVACTGEKTLTADMGPGQWTEIGLPGWDNTGNTRWNTFTQTTMVMTVLKVPADGSPISIAADTTWPYKFKGTEYTGD